MIERLYSDGDVVSGLIGVCFKNSETAEKLYQSIIVEHNLQVEMPEQTIHLTAAQYDEFVERFSSEVGTLIWESKRKKN